MFSQSKHNTIIQMMRYFGYYLTREGICAGYAQMWAQAFLCGEEDKFLKRISFITHPDFISKANQFMERMKTLGPLLSAKRASLRNMVSFTRKRIADLEKQKKLLEEVGAKALVEWLGKCLEKLNVQLSEEIAMRNSRDELLDRCYFTIDEQAIMDAFKFFDGLMGYSQPENCDEFYGKILTQGAIKKISEFTASIALEKLGGLEEIYSHSGILSEAELNNEFLALQKILQQKELANLKLPICLGSDNHRIGVRFDHQKNCWVLIDPNQAPIYIAPNNIAGYVMNAFCDRPKKTAAGEMKDSSKEPYTVFSMDIYTTSNNTSQNLKAIFAEFKQKHLITAEMAKRANVRGSMLCTIAVRCGHVDVINALAKHMDLSKCINDEGNNLAHLAVLCSQPGVINALKEHGVELDKVNYRGSTPLNTAAIDNDVIMMKALLACNVDPDKVNDEDESLVFAAVKDGFTGVIEVLAEYKADLDKGDNNGETPVCLAVKMGKTDMLSTLANCHANLNKKNKYGMAPIHIAAINNQASCISVLAKHGADLNKKNIDGITPILLAINNGHMKAVKLLLSCHVDIDEGKVLSYFFHAIEANKWEVAYCALAAIQCNISLSRVALKMVNDKLMEYSEKIIQERLEKIAAERRKQGLFTLYAPRLPPLPKSKQVEARPPMRF